MTPRTVYRRVVIEAGLDSVDEGRRATAAVLHALRDRLSAEEGRQAVAQLPRELKGLWAPGARPARMVRTHKQTFYNRVAAEARLDSMRKARAATNAVFAVLKEQLSPGEADDIEAQLPKDLKALWEAA
jgi:uncharacterized protein (DUF2267 family)